MSDIRVVDTGLERWAMECQILAPKLISNTAAPAAGPSNQATSAAAISAHSQAVAAANVLSTRLQYTGGKSHVAAVNYDAADQYSAQRISDQVV